MLILPYLLDPDMSHAVDITWCMLISQRHLAAFADLSRIVDTETAKYFARDMNKLSPDPKLGSLILRDNNIKKSINRVLRKLLKRDQSDPELYQLLQLFSQDKLEYMSTTMIDGILEDSRLIRKIPKGFTTYTDFITGEVVRKIGELEKKSLAHVTSRFEGVLPKEVERAIQDKRDVMISMVDRLLREEVEKKLDTSLDQLMSLFDYGGDSD